MAIEPTPNTEIRPANLLISKDSLPRLRLRAKKPGPTTPSSKNSTI